jgi:dsDNA-binding SOS-regulon protein
LDQSDLVSDDKQKETLSMYLAENKESLLDVLEPKKIANQETETSS